MTPANSSEQQRVEWGPFVITEKSVDELWDKLQQFPQVFDDFGKNDKQGFVARLMQRNNIFIDIGPGLGLAAGMAVRPRVDMVLHLVMFDRRLRGREGLFFEIMDEFFKTLQLRRMTAMLASDARTGIKLVQRLGFTQEGLMRDALLRDGQLFDIEIYGILKEEFDATYEAFAKGPIAHLSAQSVEPAVSLDDDKAEPANI